MLATAIERAGWSVFWDRKVPGGLSWRQFIGDELQRARCVISAWTTASVESEWVIEEAEAAKRRGVLLPIFLEQVEAPFGFQSLHGPDLSAWNGSLEAHEFRQLASDLERLLGRPTEAHAAVGDLVEQRVEPESEPAAAGQRPLEEIEESSVRQADSPAQEAIRSPGRPARIVLGGLAGFFLGLVLGQLTVEFVPVAFVAVAWGASIALTTAMNIGRRVIGFGLSGLTLATVLGLASLPSNESAAVVFVHSPLGLVLGTAAGRIWRAARG